MCPGEPSALTPSLSPTARERGEAGEQSSQVRFPGPTRAVRDAARELRQRSTHSERLLWSALRSRGLDGHKFRRQHPVGRFILDFSCPERSLAVEIDGSYHDIAEPLDSNRQKSLESLGVRFVRLPADLVERDREAAVDTIRLDFSTLPSPAHGRGDGGEGS